MMNHTWRKSSYSGAGNDCVEIRSDLGGIRDTKHRASSIAVTPGALASLVSWARPSAL